jgi:hypothetical protein
MMFSLLEVQRGDPRSNIGLVVLVVMSLCTVCKMALQ